MKKFSFKMKSLLFVALVMFFALQTGVSAVVVDTIPIGSAGTTNFALTINAAHADDSFAVYKLINVNYNATNNNVTYSWSTAADNYIDSLTSGSPYANLSVANFQNWANDSDDIKAFLGGFAAYVKSTSTAVSPSYEGTAASGICTINGMSMGQYMILGTGSSTGAYVYQIMTASFKPNAEHNVNTTAVVESKATLPNIEKAVDDRQVAIGDTVTYTVTVAVPTYPSDATNTAFSVGDVLPAGVTFKSTTSVKSNTNATVSHTGTGAEWIFNYADIKAYTSITIVYTATVNSNIIIGAPNTNTATLTYSNDPYGDGTHSVSDTEKVYSYGIQVFKVDSANHNTKIGAVEFALYKGDTATGTPITTMITNGDGLAFMKGLDVGTYTLVETKTATGYVLDDTPITITITDADVNGIVDASPAGAIYSPSGTDGYVKTTITNTKGNYNLPQTGGIGTWVFTICGLLVMVIAVVILMMSSKRRRTNK